MSNKELSAGSAGSTLSKPSGHFNWKGAKHSKHDPISSSPTTSSPPAKSSPPAQGSSSSTNPPATPPSPVPPVTPTAPITTPLGSWDGTHIPFQLPGVANAQQANTILSLVSIAENDDTSWWENYTYCQNIGDGRGYTLNIVGFCTGTGDFLWLVQNLQSFDPTHPLCALLPALEAVNNTSSTAGLESLPALVATLGSDVPYLTATWNAVIHFYWGTAVAACAQYGLIDPISLGQLYDICLNAGDLSLLAKVTSQSPSQGGSETVWLAALQTLWLALITNKTSNLDEGQPDRAEMWMGILKAGNVSLALPISVTCYGDNFTIN